MCFAGVFIFVKSLLETFSFCFHSTTLDMSVLCGTHMMFFSNIGLSPLEHYFLRIIVR